VERLYIMVCPRDRSRLFPSLGIGPQTGFGGSGSPPHVFFLARARSSCGGGGVQGGPVFEGGDDHAAAPAKGRPPAGQCDATGLHRHNVVARFSKPASVASGGGAEPMAQHGWCARTPAVAADGGGLRAGGSWRCGCDGVGGGGGVPVGTPPAGKKSGISRVFPPEIPGIPEFQ